MHTNKFILSFYILFIYPIYLVLKFSQIIENVNKNYENHIHHVTIFKQYLKVTWY